MSRATVKFLTATGSARYTDEAVQCLVGTVIRRCVGCDRVAGRVHRAWVESDGREVWIEASLLEAVPDQLAYSTPTQRAVRDHG